VVKPVESKAVPSQGPLIPPVSLVEKSGPAYNPEGKPDPFQPLRSEDEFKKKERLGKILPLQRFELSEFELVGILSLSGDRKAVVQDMTGRGYTVQVGTRIGKKEGKVTRIDPKEVVIEEPFQDYLGRVKTRRVSLKLPQVNE
jgi:Tfp pilus assembly protein PilP